MPEIRMSRDSFPISNRSFSPVVRLDPLPEFSEAVQQATREFNAFQDTMAEEGQIISANDYLEVVWLRAKRIENGIEEVDLPTVDAEQIFFGLDRPPESPFE